MSITGAERPFFALGLAPATPRPPEGALRQLVGDGDRRYDYTRRAQRRRTIRFPSVQIINPPGGQSISFQDMLGLLVRPDVGVIVIQGIGGSGKTWAAKAAYRAARTSNLFQEYVWVPLSMNSSMGHCINKIAASLSCNKGESYDLLREKIGKDICFAHDLISYCFGMPLTIVLLAGVLCDAPTQEAFSELVTKAHVALGAQISVFNTLERMVKFGYHQLPSDNVRHCLLYCLLFPEHQGIAVKELIWYWIMDGLLQKNIGFDEANHIGKEILDVLIKHGMVYLDDNGHIRMHDVVRETVSRYGKDNGYKEQHDWHVNNPISIRLEHLAKYSRRVLLMDTEMECLYGSPCCSFISSLHLRGNYLLKAMSEEFFCHMGQLEILDLSFTLIQVLPRSISCLTRLRMLLLTGCDYLKEIRHITPLVRLEVLDASGCGSLKSIGSGSFDHMVLLKVLDLSATSITFLTSIPVSMELRHLNLQGCPFLRSFRLSSPVRWITKPWTLMLKQRRQIPSFRIHTFRTKRFAHSIEPIRYLEINGTIGVPSDLDGILGHAELISLQRLAMATQLSDLNISSMEAVRELWVENCEHLESFLTAEVVQALSEVGNLHSLWISKMEKLSSFCKGVEDVTSFSCLKHLLFDCCPNLICLLPSVLHFPNLETLNIRFCDILERAFDSSALGEDTLPRLQSLQLWELPELTSVCSGVLPSLKNLKVRGCAKLRKIPVGMNENSPFVTTIGEQLWWDSLIWDDETIKRWLLFRNWGPLLPHIATEG
ncbi:unnamed protein product [Miscanthus lutarioriparius]|uniref:NB-ARC domain-containing protein n=1 Tax=Miscanthus lutarioriparius TaxID=422564 RepID=A0A811NKP6_9POAL|nr:unnamed protein product [Miscanthus lutarioriparius]